jgi:hypothetical protein
MKELASTFNIAEAGAGSYRILAILRWVMVVIFVSFGMQNSHCNRLRESRNL